MDAKQGLHAIHQHQLDIIFLDVEMPGMSGFEMLQQLAEINFDIIFTTAFNQYAIRAIKFGALDYLVKPMIKDELRAAIDIFIKRTQRNHSHN
jgi:two-component system LytT family response regulator